MSSARVSGGEVGEGLAVIGAGLLESMRELEEVHGNGDVAVGYGGHGVGGNLLIAGYLGHAALDERTDGCSHGSLVELKALLQVTLERSVDDRLIPALQTCAEDVEDADGGTAQRKGVLRAGGRLVDGEHACDSVELVGDGNDATGNALGQIVAGKAGTIMIANGGGNLGLLARCGGIVATHHALLAGELDDRRGHEVGLGQVGGTLSAGRRVGTEMGLASDGEGQVLHAV